MVASETFERCIAFVLEEEGGYTPGLPDDPGGETNFGISKRSYPNEDIKNLTVERAKEIYLRDFWLGPGLDKLPPKVALIVLDCAVNQGSGTAVRILQTALCVKADGDLGPATARAAYTAGSTPLLTMIASLRALRYAQAPNFKTWGGSWMRRLFRVFSASLLFGS